MGGRDGKEVVQMYVLPERENSSVWRPEKELKGFIKAALKAGGSRLVELESDLKVACSYWDEAERGWKMQRGSYRVQIGGLHGGFAVPDAIVWDHL